MESPAVTVLQLDTDFPRVPGDVGCLATYRGEVEILRVPKATVAQVVSARPDLINIASFETALEAAKGDVVTTSCGFLSYRQTHLALRSRKPFISSSLIALESLSQRYEPHEVLILTFDSASLTDLHFGEYSSFRNGVIGLPSDMHLRRVITENLRELDTGRVAAELTSFVSAQQRPHHKHLLLECTNLPPYKAALQHATGLPITDILTCVEAAREGTIQADFLS
ncbi:hypothetical protein [Litoreibacter halocynthiae]|uniref:hypothetical protein n=1 Tax=Litoreibacter halocynthiae TaxID=1242689 RepID=UPI00248FE4F5|nr:hypothetical protein [Litoreibacter halocynthiae]